MNIVSSRLKLWTDVPCFILSQVSSRLKLWTDVPCFMLTQVSSRLKLWMDVPCFIFPFEESLWTIHPCIQGFHSSMLICFFVDYSE